MSYVSNNGKNHYEVELDSYFESEGDVKSNVEKVFLEDEIWTRLRINPKSVPTGAIKMLPGTMFARLKHIDYKALNANATLKSNQSDKTLMTYSVEYSGTIRKLSIHFKKAFPHEIQGWEENMSSGFGAGAKTLTTKATKKKIIMSNYWSKNSNIDLGLRKELGLEP